MAKINDFERYLESKNDEIDNAAYALAVALLRTHPEQADEHVLPWDMSVIAPITEAAKDVLERHGKQPCWPYYEEEMRCFRATSCKTPNCYFDNDRRNDEE